MNTQSGYLTRCLVILGSSSFAGRCNWTMKPVLDWYLLYNLNKSTNCPRLWSACWTKFTKISIFQDGEYHTGDVGRYVGNVQYSSSFHKHWVLSSKCMSGQFILVITLKSSWERMDFFQCPGNQSHPHKVDAFFPRDFLGGTRSIKGCIYLTMEPILSIQWMNLCNM